ncbi:ARF GTPase-activating protein GIT2 isoform X15 [Vulpes vulpes]|uniref:GIT ArfGAP 2 n=3 Tax=Canidae TaxID=9608 RepID=A0A8C0PAH3_CANLF|nr:ARF GTPase-activating protein GIT2 isoform X6 [Canis lupus familiaris]XP_025330035.1 ARF GTPase-activating protein GIT2 isoform X7 [Canis lupus dingo]XP_025842456.1 ARF GTPase-activating protein GIT2 isoform X8 [Vulpes vulpes]XP_038292892.1 ARF GTPase-activating protein GIT2 isoform X6 [Canis lupus familiaris]XP_038431300.1 ARF GTPase-activating protein GIT2 isoform X6 [Canis lupus familiaris]XP_041584756.1 ARF GTPase-activating protein GIT2 isoform X5 [Vulpes lagopus]|eukprot:XP_005636377.1 ARF GTPase-activating protein GIT2 isoform X8 [Canis lupus familiaris]
MSKRLRSSEVCADCSGPDPSWASVNRGTFICDECCSVHRSLGRHISQVRHLKHTPWPPTLLQMVETLYNNGANSIWEHSLLDPASIMSGRRKANPQDKVHPNKAEFIRAKYQMLAFVHRLPCRDDDSMTAKDLSKQLHSSVRTGNLETCLRLLSLGAQANFFHPEKGNTPLHVASKAGQILQAELLAVYGADPGTQDSSGKTPVDYARQGGHHELAERLVEIQYELTDRLAFYLCGRKPDHKNGQHFIIPQMADSLDLSELAKAAKKKLQSLSNHLFEELAMDVYDEVDRRETDAVWLATQNHSTLVTETTVVPFLPVNPEYSSTRNQGRQKLARFNAHEFATLVIDILSDAKRRQQGSPLSGSKDNVELILKTISNQHSIESQDNDQPDYDSVASDEDTDLEATASKANRQKLQTLQSENSNLRKQATTNIYQVQTGSEYTDTSNHSSLKRRPSARGSRPMSMYETGSGQKPYLPMGEVNHPEESRTRLQPFPTHIGRSALVTSSSSLPSFPSTLSWSRDESARRASRLEKQNSTPESDYDNTPNDTDPDDTGSSRKGRQRSMVWQGDGSVPDTVEPHTAPSPILPSTEDVIRKTEQITKNIQELLRAAQENKHDSYIPCSERIHVAVTEMAALFPKKPKSDTVRTSLRLLTSSAYRLQSECKKTLPGDPGPPTDIQLVTQQVIQCAYDIAKAAKQLVTITTKENNN